MILLDLQMAARNLLQHRKRTVFLLLATAGVTALLILLNSLTASIEEMTVRAGSTLMTGHVNLSGFYKPTMGTAVPIVLDYKKALDKALPEIPELDYWVERGRGYAKAVSETGSMDQVIAGIDIAKEPGFREVIQLVAGNFDDLANPNAVLIFEKQAKKLQVGVGDALTIAAPTVRSVNNTADVQVVAVAKDLGILSNLFLVMQNETLRGLYQLKEGSTGAAQIYLKDPSKSLQVERRIRKVLAAQGYTLLPPDPRAYFMKLYTTVNREEWTGQRLDITTWEDEMSFLTDSLRMLKTLSVFLVFVLSIIVAVGIMNTLWVAIRERTREIGTLRAFGMQRLRVAYLFLIEAMLLGLTGSLLGAVGALLVVAGLNAANIPVSEMAAMFLMSDRVRLVVTPGSVLFAVALLTAVTTLAAIYPSYRAARLKPVTAMHHVG